MLYYLSINFARYIHISISQSIKSVGHIFTSNHVRQRTNSSSTLPPSYCQIGSWCEYHPVSSWCYVPKCQDCSLTTPCHSEFFFPCMSSLIKAHGFEICLAEIQTEVIFFSESVRYKLYEFLHIIIMTLFWSYIWLVCS